MIPPRSLTETGNFRPEVASIDAGATSNLYLMSKEFLRLSRAELLHGADFTQRGMLRYDIGMFCLGHALELTYKTLLRRDSIKYPYVHDPAQLLGLMSMETRDGVDSLVKRAGWSSSDEFHQHLREKIKVVDRKYFEGHSGLDDWTHDRTGHGIEHRLWPRMLSLCERLHQFAASLIWIDPSLPPYAEE